MMKNIITFLIFMISIVFCTNAFGQTIFESTKYPYNFTIPDGWKIKEKIYLPETDAKIVDDRGNSFIISVKALPSEFKGRSAVILLSSQSDDAIKASLSPGNFESLIIYNRHSTNINGREFYYVSASAPFEGSLRLNHKLFYFNYKSKMYTIDCSSISSMTNEASVYFDLMLQTLKFK
jgi:hypothetical protein